MKSTFRILFYLKKNEPKKDGTVTIMARITVDGETKQFSTKKTILPEDWDIKSGRAVNKSGKSTSAKISKLNKELDDLRGQISIQYTKQLNNNGYVEPEKLRNNVLGIEEKQHSLLTYFTEHNLQYKDKVGTTATQKTYSRYELTKQRLIDFMKVKYRVSDILIREINAVFIEISDESLPRDFLEKDTERSAVHPHVAGNVIQRNIPLGVTNDVDLYPIHSLPFRVHLLILPHHTLFLAPGKNKQQFYHQRDAFSPPQRTHLLEDRSNSRRLFLPELHGIPFPFQLLRTFLQLRESNTAVVKKFPAKSYRDIGNTPLRICHIILEIPAMRYLRRNYHYFPTPERFSTVTYQPHA